MIALESSGSNPMLIFSLFSVNYFFLLFLLDISTQSDTESEYGQNIIFYGDFFKAINYDLQTPRPNYHLRPLVTSAPTTSAPDTSAPVTSVPLSPRPLVTLNKTR